MIQAKPLEVVKWLNIDSNTSFDPNQKRIRFIHFFQMLCPGCVYYGIPQTIDLFHRFRNTPIQVMAIHSVFENHEVMNEDALRVFIKEFQLPFPVGIDRHEDGHWKPLTLKNYQLQGTPSSVVIDAENNLRLSHFGHFDQDQLVQFLNDLNHEQKQKESL